MNDSAESKILSQHIFSLELSQKLLIPLALKYLPNLSLLPELSKLKGRVRSIEASKIKTYMLGLKGPKEEDFKKLNIVSKPEIEIEINEYEFLQLVNLADKGYIKKRRTVVPCVIEHLGSIYNYYAEFDLILEVNGVPLKANFLIIEIEIPETNCQRLITAVRSGKISLDFTTKLVDFKIFRPVEVAIDCQEDYSDLIAGRKLVCNISKDGPAEHLRKYFNE